MQRFLPVLLCFLAGPVLAQSAAPAPEPATASAITDAAATITEADIARRIGIIAHDSMKGRDTPSRGLTLTAQYIAGQFEQFGLAPGGENGGYFQEYPILTWELATESSAVSLTHGGHTARAGFDESARYVFGAVPDSAIEGPILVIGGDFDAASVAAADAGGKVVVAVMSIGPSVAARRDGGLRALLGLHPRAIVMITNRPDDALNRQIANQGRRRTALDLESADAGRPVIVEVRGNAVQEWATAAGVDFDSLWASDETHVIPTDGTARIELRRRIIERVTAPNVIGILKGSDPALADEYLVYSAHMDHVGVGRPVDGDSIYNGADDDASGTTAIVELAEAFSRPGARPKRSIIFMTVSGEEKGLWGSRYFSENPTVPLESVVADLNVDMIGRNWPDTIVAIGKEHSDLGTTLERVNAEHPELGLTAIDDIWPEERFYFRSDHYNFARKGVPILFFFSGVHEDYHRPSDEPAKINAEKEARIVQLLYYLGQEVANAPNRPQWNPESYREIVEGER